MQSFLLIPTFNTMLTVGQITRFFEDSNQMALKNRIMVNLLVAEDIVAVNEFKEWDNDNWDQWAVNCKRPVKIADPN